MASAQVRVFALLGDSNIQRHINKTSLRASPGLKSAQVLPCGHVGIFQETLGKVRPDVSVCIVSCLTNFLTGADGPPPVSHRIDAVLQTILASVVEFCTNQPDRLCLLSPPMYRTAPVWYREGLPEVLTLFSQTFSASRPDNLRILPSFPTPEFEADGVHLTAYSGLEYVLHLFDAAQDLIEKFKASPEEVLVQSCESTRVLEDRVMVLEQDHRRLNAVVERKTAADAELADHHANEKFVDSFVIHGLKPISSDLIGKAWQVQALADVQEVLKFLFGREFDIIVVQNATSRVPGAEVKYNVKMAKIADSELIRKKFGSFFLGSKDGRPKEVKHINIKNRVTPETKTRIDLLKLMAARYRSANPEGRAQVISYDTRPLIKITPPPSSADRRIKTYHFAEAVKRLPCTWPESEVEPILRRINPELMGQIRSLFVVLSDDQFRKVLGQMRKPKPPAAAAADATASDAAMSEAGSDQDDPPAAEAFNRPSGKGKGRNAKRGASSSSGGPSAKK